MTTMLLCLGLPLYMFIAGVVMQVSARRSNESVFDEHPGHFFAGLTWPVFGIMVLGMSTVDLVHNRKILPKAIARELKP